MGKSRGTKEFWLDALRSETAAFQTTVAQDGALDLPVPSCPDWTIADLVRHAGRLCLWIGEHVARGVTSRPDVFPPSAYQITVPQDVPLVEWYAARAAELIATLDLVDPDLPAWNWAPQPKRAVFWHRRAANEFALHRWDAQMATGLAEPIEPRLAADGLTEVLDTWLASGLRHNPDAGTGMVALSATDIDEVWYVRLRPDGIALLDTDTLLDDDDLHERATAIGSASDLVLAVYGRVPFEVLQISGDASLLDGLRTG
jgi:uncharacterized protein (TIGR03083 family)